MPVNARIRLARQNDSDGVAAIYGPCVARSATSFELTPPDVHEMGRRITDTLHTLPWLVCEHNGRLMGYAYGSKHRTRAAYQWSVETSVYVAPAWQRHGIGRGLYTALFALLALQGYYNAYAGIALPNPGSVALHEAMGFRPVGVYREVGFKAGAWHDVGWWALSLQPKTTSPSPPLPLAAAQTRPGWAAALAAGERLPRV
jgi:L-amino acid N-acyltransferase YncA